MKVAIVHYWLFHMRGGEQVLEALCEMYPEADIYTHVYDPRHVSEGIRRHKVQTTFIQRMPFARKMYKAYLPFMPLALEMLDLSNYDLVISSESGPAKGVIVRADATHICYCHTPMRYLWDQYHVYYKGAGSLSRLSMPYLLHRMRRWDVTSAARVDHFIANSNCVAERIHKFWRRDSEVIAPPVSIDKFYVSADHDDFYLCVNELVGYKRVDLAIAACNALQRRLVVIGDGPEAKALQKMAGPTIEFLGHVPHSVLRDYLSRCRALLFPAYEDFGITPVEALASGRPVVAFARGGVRDTLIDGRTGALFAEQTPPSLIEAMIRFEAVEHVFDSEFMANHAAKFSRAVFKEKFAASVARQLSSPLTMPFRQEPVQRSLLQAIQ